MISLYSHILDNKSISGFFVGTTHLNGYDYYHPSISNKASILTVLRTRQGQEFLFDSFSFDRTFDDAQDIISLKNHFQLLDFTSFLVTYHKNIGFLPQNYVYNKTISHSANLQHVDPSFTSIDIDIYDYVEFLSPCCECA